MKKRSPKVNELSMIRFLLKSSKYNYTDDLFDSLIVESMDDGGMGSLLIFTNDFSNKNRIFANTISEYTFKDKDDVDVNICLNIDSDGNLFELDIWKVDFSPLICLPIMDIES